MCVLGVQLCMCVRGVVCECVDVCVGCAGVWVCEEGLYVSRCVCRVCVGV